MNKKDCSDISWILAQINYIDEDTLESFFELDKRIKENYDFDRRYVKSQLRARVLYTEAMESQYGEHWSLVRDKPDSKKIWDKAEEQAKKEFMQPLEYDDKDDV